MRQKIKNITQHLPSGTSGLGLGSISLGGIWFFFMRYIYQNTNEILYYDFGLIVYWMTFIFGTYCFISILVKFSFNFKLFMHEWKGSATSGFLPTKWMLLIQLIAFISGLYTGSHDKDFNYDYVTRVVNVGTIIGSIISIIALLLQLIMLVGFLTFVIKNHKIKSDLAYSSWFVPTVGIVIICNAYPNFGNVIPIEFYRFVWFIGFGLYALFLPIILYKIIFFKYSEKPQFASMGVFVSPGCLLLASFLSIFTDLNSYFAYDSKFFCYFMVMILIAITMLGMFIFFISLLKIISQGFHTNWTALTYPSAVTSTAFLRLYADFKDLQDLEKVSTFAHNFFGAAYTFFLVIGSIFLIISTLIISYVSFRYLVIHFQVYFRKLQFENDL
ncbi:SLAC1 family transporter [Mycoplasmopsis alligatoris]|uniref:C4-dicarboxylate transporter/malic acid transport protein n=1 Tax=Mycoplasmopsis alligatoris A21JP2 TaxID=747682 RepID=D4XWF4_9BACT|nr:C4-dicarboxylate ABC transporter [Mycoplasmopsis alligatoris]EFF41222.1 C4-dicarboxylate transporter/malic acid transport protein [Mycoplasmopsis alligatoris A21JP2]